MALRSPGTVQLDRRIFALALPALGALIAQPGYVLVDTAVVGHLGTPQLGGLAVASAAVLTAQSIFIFLAYGTTAAVARLLGAGDERAAAHQAVQGLWFAGLLGVVLVPIGYLTRRPLLELLGASGEVLVHAEVYLRYSLLGIPALLLTMAGTGYLRGRQDTRTPLWVALGANTVNLVAELTLIVGLGYGIGASALSTIAAEWIAACIFVARVLRPVRALGVSLRPDRAALAQLGRVGSNLLIRTIALRGAFTVSVAVAARIGERDVAAHEIALQVWNLLSLGLDAIAIAGQSLIGNALGASDAREARRVGQRLVQWGVIAGVALAGFVALSSPLLPRLFSPDADLRSLTSFALLIVALLLPAAAVVYVLDGVLIGAGDMRFLAWSMALVAAIYYGCVGFVGTAGLGLGWVWASLAVLMAGRLVALWGRFRTDAWLVTGAVRAR